MYNKNLSIIKPIDLRTAYIFRYKENWATISFRYTLGYIAKTFVVAVCGRNITQQLFNGKKVELFC